MKERIKKIFNNIKQKPNFIIIKNSDEPHIDENFFYVTGLDKGLFEGSCAILFPDGKIHLLVSELEEQSAKKANAEIFVYKNEKDFYDTLKKSISDNKNIGLNFKRITLKDFLKLKNNISDADFIDVSDAFSKARIIKDEYELDKIKKACKIVDRVVEKIPDLLSLEMPEFELAAEIDYLMQKNGADKQAFETISSFGKNSSEPHYSHGETKLRKGDFVLCDFGACYKKYNSDITRTFVFGKASSLQKEMYETVYNSQQMAFDKIKAGVKASDVHNSVNSFIEKTKFKGKFIHSTGHSLGLSVHDGEVRLSQNSNVQLQEGMVFTVEPGVYLPEIGGVRIEDDVLIKKEKVELLTKASRVFLEI